MDPRSLKNLRPSAVIETVQGRGNLDAKAYFAAIVGPLRAVFGKTTSPTLVEATVTQLVRNAGVTAQWAYVTVLLPGNAAAPKVGMFTDSPSNGFNTALPVTLQKTMGSAGGNSFAAVLAPGESLYGRSAPGEGSFKVVVSTVWF
jgi:hypothetical protein